MSTKHIKKKHKALYDLLKQHEYKLVSIEDFRNLLSVSNEKYTRFNDLRKRVINAFQNDINKNSNIHIEYKLKKSGRNIIAINFLITEQTQSELFQFDDHKIPASVIDMIPIEYLNSCINICQKILHRDGVAGLKFYLEDCNKNFKADYYSEYLINIFSLQIYDDYLDAQKRVLNAIQQKDMAEHRAELQEREDALYRHSLLEQVNTRELDNYIMQNLTFSERQKIRGVDFHELRLKFIESFLEDMINNI